MSISSDESVCNIPRKSKTDSNPLMCSNTAHIEITVA